MSQAQVTTSPTKQIVLTGYLYRGVFIYREETNRFVIFDSNGQFYAFESQSDVEAAINELLDTSLILMNHLHLDA